MICFNEKPQISFFSYILSVYLEDYIYRNTYLETTSACNGKSNAKLWVNTVYKLCLFQPFRQIQEIDEMSPDSWDVRILSFK